MERLTKDPKIVWLASYPKSGNTWFRSFLSALLTNEAVDINKMVTNGIFSAKCFSEETLDFNADYLTQRQVEYFQRITFSYLAAKSDKLLYFKIHDAFTFSEIDGLPLIPESPSKLAIYLVRNPLDVVLSLANHVGISIDQTIDKFIINPSGAFSRLRNSYQNQFYQPLGTWSMHVESWLKIPSFPVHFMRYEDMKAKPFETFKSAVNAIGLQADDKQIEQAIEATEFEKLQKQEQEKDFKEKSKPATTFFFKGKVDRWKEELTLQQIEKIRNANEPMMRHFGYW
ncbi:sulfotransferase family protein [Emticicia fontis]